jgi:hypothetical protein
MHEVGTRFVGNQFDDYNFNPRYATNAPTQLAIALRLHSNNIAFTKKLTVPAPRLAHPKKGNSIQLLLKYSFFVRQKTRHKFITRPQE